MSGAAIEAARSGRLVDPREMPVRFSNLKRIGQSPAHYLAALSSDRDTPSLRKGRAVHSMLLGNPADVAVYTGPTRGKGAKTEREAWKAEQLLAGRTILSVAQNDAVQRMRDAIMAHRDARSVLFGRDVSTEKTLHWTDQGRKCRGTPDVVRGADYVAELKTDLSSEPGRFNTRGRWYEYHSQLAWYRGGLVHSGAGRPRDALIVAVESSAPYPVTVFELTPRALDLGERTCRLWFERLLVCEASNRFPPYIECRVPFDVPDEDGDGGGFSLRIGGEDVHVGGDGGGPLLPDASDEDDEEGLF